MKIPWLVCGELKFRKSKVEKVGKPQQMIGSEDLLMDYEVRKKQIENLRIEVVEKTNRHHELMQWITKWQPVVQQRQASLRKARTP